MVDPAYYRPSLDAPTPWTRWIQVRGKFWSMAHLYLEDKPAYEPWTLCWKFIGGYDRVTAWKTVARCRRCVRALKRRTA